MMKGSIKYSGQKLYKKGVALEIEGLPKSQFKNVQFEISAIFASMLPGLVLVTDLVLVSKIF